MLTKYDCKSVEWEMNGQVPRYGILDFQFGVLKREYLVRGNFALVHSNGGVVLLIGLVFLSPLLTVILMSNCLFISCKHF